MYRGTSSSRPAGYNDQQDLTSLTTTRPSFVTRYGSRGVLALYITNELRLSHKLAGLSPRRLARLPSCGWRLGPAEGREPGSSKHSNGKDVASRPRGKTTSNTGRTIPTIPRFYRPIFATFFYGMCPARYWWGGKGGRHKKGGQREGEGKESVKKGKE